MRLPYKATQLALYGNGERIFIATTKSKNRVVAFDKNVVFLLEWEDQVNSKSNFSVSIGRIDVVNILRKGKPYDGFYDLRIAADGKKAIFFDHQTLIKTADTRTSVVGIVPFEDIDINIAVPYYRGLMNEQNEVTGSVTVDFDRLKDVFDFMNGYIASGRFGGTDVRAVNFQTSNENMPLLIQAFVKLEGNILGDLNVSFAAFNR